MRIPKYRRHSSGQARVVINDRAIYLGKYGSAASKKRYDAIIQEYLASDRSACFGLEGAVTVGSLIVDYMKYAKQYYGTGKESEVHRLKYALRPLADLYSHHPVEQFGPQQFKTVRQKMIDMGWTRSGINSQMKRILRAIKWGASEGRYPAAIYDTLKLIPSLAKGRTEAKESKPIECVSGDDVARTVQHCTPVVADMIRIQMLTGCRPGEVCKLTPAMIDRSGEVWEARLEEHKTAHHGKSRTLFLGREAQEILTPYLHRPDDCRLFRPCDSERLRHRARGEQRVTPMNCGNRSGYTKQTRGKGISKRKVGEAYSTQSYGKSISYACRKANVELWSPNQLRHTKLTELRKEHGLEIAAVIAGHSKIETTQIYAEANREKAIQVIARK